MLAKHWYMPVSSAARLEMDSTETFGKFLLIEITPPALSCTPLWYQVTVGVGIPDSTQEKVTDCPISCSRSKGGFFVITGGAKWGRKLW